ncbi:MAG: stage II sporulation protein R [Syntrophomonadaceae bacterium]|nr:stage II sporulation protein R [Syntrophomonadaceae bacterium]
MLRFHPLIAAAVLVALLLGFHQYQIHQNPCYEVLRLHVVANSNRLDDQKVKLKVRDSIINLMGNRLAKVESADAAYRIAADSIPDIEQAARETLAAHGYDYPVTVSVGNFDFPTRFYGAQVFPCGEYAAVRVVLGEGRGQNWWCVLFPPLCLKNLDQDGGKAGGVELRLKVVEIFKDKNWLHRSVAGR